MFDINKAIKDSRLSKTEIVRLQKEVKKDYPHDSMLYELHMIRALKPKVTRIVNQRHGLGSPR
jgi:hypothetical protein